MAWIQRVLWVSERWFHDFYWACVWRRALFFLLVPHFQLQRLLPLMIIGPNLCEWLCSRKGRQEWPIALSEFHCTRHCADERGTVPSEEAPSMVGEEVSFPTNKLSLGREGGRLFISGDSVFRHVDRWVPNPLTDCRVTSMLNTKIIDITCGFSRLIDIAGEEPI